MDIYELKTMSLHEEYNKSNFSILRVPNGWLYTIRAPIYKDGFYEGDMITSTFVPERL